jgi:predicted KAP-like P-loop ATPase
MKLKAPEIEIPPTDPFKNDLLSRKITAEQLTEILKSFDEPLVLCINSPWGNGKTTFIKMWREYLKQDGFKTLYFNAWENDYSEDALVSLIGELSASMGELKLTGQKARKFKDT